MLFCGPYVLGASHVCRGSSSMVSLYASSAILPDTFASIFPTGNGSSSKSESAESALMSWGFIGTTGTEKPVDTLAPPPGPAAAAPSSDACPSPPSSSLSLSTFTLSKVTNTDGSSGSSSSSSSSLYQCLPPPATTACELWSPASLGGFHVIMPSSASPSCKTAALPPTAAARLAERPIIIFSASKSSSKSSKSESLDMLYSSSSLSLSSFSSKPSPITAIMPLLIIVTSAAVR
mmetsp:Transcript_25611/g.77770  ORF Transcript_25611/g.77770 Transcript_25611/m.77770 type:complete len:234 (+) Transcript_25611:696-1397(+)